MNYEITIDGFDGPLDLLLHLIKKSNIDIVDININDVTIKLDGSIMNDKKKGNCCKGNVNEKKIKVRHKSHSANQSSINKYVNANENKDK